VEERTKSHSQSNVHTFLFVCLFVNALPNITTERLEVLLRIRYVTGSILVYPDSG